MAKAVRRGSILAGLAVLAGATPEAPKAYLEVTRRPQGSNSTVTTSLASKAAEYVGVGVARVAARVPGVAPSGKSAASGVAGLVGGGVGGLVGGGSGALAGAAAGGVLADGLSEWFAYPSWSFGTRLLDHSGKTPGECAVEQVRELALKSSPSGPLHECLRGAGVSAREPHACRILGSSKRAARRVIRDVADRLLATARLEAPAYEISLRQEASRVFAAWESESLDLGQALQELSSDLDYAVMLEDCKRVVSEDDAKKAKALDFLSGLSGPELDYRACLWAISRVADPNILVGLFVLVALGAGVFERWARASEEQRASDFAAGMRYAKLQLWRGMTVTLPAVRAVSKLRVLAKRLREAPEPTDTEGRQALRALKRDFERLVAEVAGVRPILTATLRAVATCGHEGFDDFRRGRLAAFLGAVRERSLRAGRAALRSSVKVAAAVPRLVGNVAAVAVGTVATPLLSAPLGFAAQQIAERVATIMELSLSPLPSDEELAEIRRLDAKAGDAVEELRSLLPSVRDLLVDDVWKAEIQNLRESRQSYLQAPEAQTESLAKMDKELETKLVAAAGDESRAAERCILTALRETIGAVLRGEPERALDCEDLGRKLQARLAEIERKRDRH